METGLYNRFLINTFRLPAAWQDVFAEEKVRADDLFNELIHALRTDGIVSERFSYGSKADRYTEKKNSTGYSRNCSKIRTS